MHMAQASHAVVKRTKEQILIKPIISVHCTLYINF